MNLHMFGFCKDCHDVIIVRSGELNGHLGMDADALKQYIKVHACKTWLQISDAKGESVHLRSLLSLIKTRYNVTLGNSEAEEAPEELEQRALQFLYHKVRESDHDRRPRNNKWSKLRDTLRQVRQVKSGAPGHSWIGGHYMIDEEEAITSLPVHKGTEISPTICRTRPANKREVEDIRKLLATLSSKTEIKDDEDTARQISARAVISLSVSPNPNSSLNIDLVTINGSACNVVTLRPDKGITLEDLVSHRNAVGDAGGIDNTGNVRVWPAEEWLVILLSTRTGILRDADILELGAGSCGLASFYMAQQCFNVKSITCTDGNINAAANLRKVMAFYCLRARQKENHGQHILQHPLIRTDILPWKNTCMKGGYTPSLSHVEVKDLCLVHGEGSSMRFDLIVCADCLFFEEFHGHLCNTMYHCMEDPTFSETTDFPQVWLLAPSRGGSRERFLEVLGDFSPQCDCRLPKNTSHCFEIVCEDLADVLKRTGASCSHTESLLESDTDRLLLVTVQWNRKAWNLPMS